MVENKGKHSYTTYDMSLLCSESKKNTQQHWINGLLANS